MSVFDYHRRPTIEVEIGGVPLGGDNPIRLQSMTNTSTMDTDGSVAQCERIARAGADYVRLTAQGVREAANIGVVRSRLRADGINTPLVADIHFNPRAATAAAPVVDKVRINPGNFVDPGRVFKKLEYTPEQYAAELTRIDETLTPFLALCKANGTALRIGVNHGSLSDRIMSRYGDTPAGMVESAMEFLRVCVARGFMDVVISIKASNTVVMVETVRRLVRAMEAEGMKFPLHLGVTEAGDGEDGRVKSAVGIGTLLAEGIGDTVRVSLSEPPENEIPVAASLVNYITARAAAQSIAGEYADGYDPITPTRRATAAIGIVGGDNPPVVVGADHAIDYHSDIKPDIYLSQIPHIVFDASQPIEEIAAAIAANDGKIAVMTSTHSNPIGEIQAALHAMAAKGIDTPVIPRLVYDGIPAGEVTIRAAADMGALLMNGARDGVMIESDSLTPDEIARLSFGILQAARQRFTRTEYIACPGCGRTLFDLQGTLKQVKEATAHLKGLKIGVMGCIVNGPGEMADADYGYVGAAAGKVSLYKGKVCMEKNLDASEALPRLIQLIKDSGDWTDSKK